LSRRSAAAGALLGHERLAQTPGLTAVELFAAIGRGEVKAVWIMGTNPVVSLPDSHAVSQALAGCPLVIVSDVAADRYRTFRPYPFPALAWGEKMARSPTRSGGSPASAAFCRRRGGESRLVDHRPRGSAGLCEAFAWQHPHESSASMRRCPV
jgi:assimilatory nitrate reductase catalytic subunit